MDVDLQPVTRSPREIEYWQRRLTLLCYAANSQFNDVGKYITVYNEEDTHTFYTYEEACRYILIYEWDNFVNTFAHCEIKTKNDMRRYIAFNCIGDVYHIWDGFARATKHYLFWYENVIKIITDDENELINNLPEKCKLIDWNDNDHRCRFLHCTDEAASFLKLKYK